MYFSSFINKKFIQKRIYNVYRSTFTLDIDTFTKYPNAYSYALFKYKQL